MSGETLRLAEFSLRAEPPARAIAAAYAALERALRTGEGSEPTPRGALLVAATGQDSPPQATVFGTGTRAGVTWAAMANGAASGESEVAAAVAVGEWKQRTLADVLAAIAAGSELGHRIETALQDSPSRRSWAAGGAKAVLGAAAAAGRLLHLDPERQAMAIGLAATQVAGLGIVADDPGGHALLFGRAAFDGTEAALLVAAGYTAPISGIEGRRGLAALTAPGAVLGGMVKDLGERWETISDLPEAGSAQPPYPDGISIEEAIELILAGAGKGLEK